MPEAIFRAYFSEGEDVGDLETLVAIACRVGMESERVRAFLSADEGHREVRALEQRARYLAVQSVPHVVINENLVVNGARDAQDFVEAIEASMKKGSASGEALPV